MDATVLRACEAWKEHTDVEPRLHAAWDDLVAALGVDGSRADAARADLEARYTEPHRAYHTLVHLAQVLATVDDLAAAGEVPADRDAVRVAAWFHDAVYDPRAGGNEAASADLADAVLAGWQASGAFRRRVRQLVMVTADHRPGDVDEAVLSDADLAILAADPATYAGYARAIRSEYAWIPEAGWRTGRGAFLRDMLDRDHLFATVTMRESAEAAARRNLAAELAGLRGD